MIDVALNVAAASNERKGGTEGPAL